MIPIFLPKSFFKQLDKHISTFIWNKSNPRMRKVYLERSKWERGLGLPNFMHYYWAASVLKFPYWIITFSDQEGPIWSHMELQASLPTSPISLLTSPLPLKPNTHLSNPSVHYSLRIWNQFRKHFSLKQASTFSPITFNHLFLPSQTDSAFKLWRRNGLVFFSDLFIDNNFTTFDYICNDNNVPMSYLF